MDLLDVFGVDYIAQHVIHAYQQEQKEFAYRVYVSDALKLIAENTEKYAGGSHLTKRWADIVKQKPADKRTGAEIARDVIKAAGLVVI